MTNRDLAGSNKMMCKNNYLNKKSYDNCKTIIKIINFYNYYKFFISFLLFLLLL